MGEIVKKHKIALFVNKGTAETAQWVRIEKSTELEISMNPATQEFDYIADETPTTELEKYNPSISQALTMYKDNPDYEVVFPKLFGMATGSEASLPVLVAFYQEPVDTTDPHTHFLAWHAPNAVFVADNLSAVASTISCNLYLNGGIKKGYVTVTDKVPAFTEGTYTTE